MWRKVLCYLLILTIPVSTWASVSVASDCPHGSEELQNTVKVANDHDCHSTSAQDEQVLPSNTTPSNSCQCSSHIDCFSTLMNVTGIPADNKLIIINSTNQLLGHNTTLRLPITIASLFRPPITIS